MLECSICLDSLQADDAALSSLRCGHLLHADCLNQHLAIYERCPICSAPTYLNDPSIRRIFLSAPDQRTPSPEAEAALELVQVKQALARSGAQLENERVEKEAVEREVILQARERQAAEEKLQRADHTKHRYKRERDDLTTQLTTTSARLREETETREKEKTKAGQQEKMLRVQIANLNTALKAAKAEPKPKPKPKALRQSHLLASPSPRSSKRLGATSSLEILASPPPAKRTRLAEKRRSQSASVGNKKRKAVSEEFSDEAEDGSATELEEDELDEDLLLEDEEIDVDGEEEEDDDGMDIGGGALTLMVSWSGRGNPSVELVLKGTDTIRTLGKLFLERSGMKPASFKGPTGAIFERIRNKNKTIAELRDGSRLLTVSALGCVRPA